MSAHDAAARAASRPAPLPRTTVGLFTLLFLLGVIGMVIGHVQDPTRAWQAYLVNFLFWFAVGVGGVLFSCVIYMASGRWGRNVRRVADGLAAFLPVSLVLFLVLIPFLRHVIPWFTHPWAKTEWQKWWLDPRFLVLRDAGAIAFLLLVGMYIVYRALRVDLGHANERGGAYRGTLHALVTRGWKGTDREAAAARKTIAYLAPVYAIAFAWLLTILAMDLIMSLHAGFYSTLVGGYYFAGSFYVALAVMLIAVVWTRKHFGLYEEIRPNHLHDIAKLTMAFGVVTGDFFYGQLLVIWYGNIPHETSFLIERWAGTPWRFVAIAILLLCFAWPLVWMLKRSLKERALPVVVFAAVVLGAMWTLRFFEIAPSIAGSGAFPMPSFGARAADVLARKAIPFGLYEILVTLGFAGLVGLSFTVFMHRVPPVVTCDPVLDFLQEDEG